MFAQFVFAVDVAALLRLCPWKMLVLISASFINQWPLCPPGYSFSTISMIKFQKNYEKVTNFTKNCICQKKTYLSQFRPTKLGITMQDFLTIVQGEVVPSMQLSGY